MNTVSHNDTSIQHDLCNGRFQVLRRVHAEQNVTRPRSFSVLVAFDRRLQRQVILKTVNAQHSTALSSNNLFLLAREAAVMKTLNHPQFARLLDTFYEGAQYYLVIDFIEGETLAAWLGKQHDLPPVSTVVHIGRQVAWMLDYLQQQLRPIIHRDLKPANLMIVRHAAPLRLALIDFGIARYAGHLSPRHPLPVARGRLDTFPYLGTWGYCAPEQYSVEGDVCSGQTTCASDVYSLGVMLHYMLSGENPMLKSEQELFTFSPLQQSARIPTPVANFVHSLLQDAPMQRPTSRQAYYQLTSLLQAQLTSKL